MVTQAQVHAQGSEAERPNVLKMLGNYFKSQSNNGTPTTNTATTSNLVLGKRVALVIGNAKYDDKPLRNPENDATDITAALIKTGLRREDIQTHTNLDRRSLNQAPIGAPLPMRVYSGST